MSTQVINPKLLDNLKGKKYRDLYVSSQVNKTIPFQIRALLAARDNMTQGELAEKAGTTQSVISRILNRGAASLNIKSLLKLASAFDVALVVRFEPIDRFIDWVDDLSPEAMSPKPSEVVLAEIEREASEPKSVHRGTARETSGHQLRLVQTPAMVGLRQSSVPTESPLLAVGDDVTSVFGLQRKTADSPSSATGAQLIKIRA